MMKVLLSVICFLAVTSSDDGVRTRYVNDYKKIMAVYGSVVTPLSFKVVYRSFDHTSTTPDTTLTARFIMHGDNFYSKMGRNETYKNKQYYVTVNHDFKMIAINRASSASTHLFSLDKIDTLLSILKYKMAYTEINQGKTGRYIIETKEQGDIGKSKLILEFNLSTNRVSRFVNYLYDYEVAPYAESPSSHVPYIEVLYSDYTTVNVSPETFSTSKYFTATQSGDVQLKPAYAHYQLINSLPYNSGR